MWTPCVHLRLREAVLHDVKLILLHYIARLNQRFPLSFIIGQHIKNLTKDSLYVQPIDITGIYEHSKAIIFLYCHL